MKYASLALISASLAMIPLPSGAAPLDRINGSVNSGQQVTHAIWAQGCYNSNDEVRCRTVIVQELTDVFDGSTETRFQYIYTRSGPTIWGYRYFNCPVDPKSLTVTPNRAVFDAFADPSASGCQNEGTLWVNGIPQDWPWFVPLGVKGEMTNPGFQQSAVTTFTNRDNVNGSFNRQQCQGGDANLILGGGVSFGTADGNYLYFPFTYGQAEGTYSFLTCHSIQH
jgi:hypothetical protein